MVGMVKIYQPDISPIQEVPKRRIISTSVLVKDPGCTNLILQVLYCAMIKRKGRRVLVSIIILFILNYPCPVILILLIPFLSLFFILILLLFILSNRILLNRVFFFQYSPSQYILIVLLSFVSVSFPYSTSPSFLMLVL